MGDVFNSLIACSVNALVEELSITVPDNGSRVEVTREEVGRSC